MNRSPIAVCAVLLLSGHALLRAGAPLRADARWSELAPRVVGRQVALVLPEGTRVEGRVRAVEPDGLRLKVSKTSDRRVLARGERVIPRQAVSVLRVTEHRKLGRLLVTTAALAAAGGLVAAKYPDVYEGPALIAVPAVVAVGMAGVGVGAYYAGKALDKRKIEIRVVAEPVPGP